MSSTLSAVRRSRIPALAAAVCTVAAGLTLGLPSAHAAPATEWEFDAPGSYSWTVPAGVDVVYVALWGAAGGGSSPGGHGGIGAFVDGALEVTPGDTYEIYVGGTGRRPFHRRTARPTPAATTAAATAEPRAATAVGGGGGGATDLRCDGTALGDRVMVAAAAEVGAARGRDRLGRGRRRRRPTTT